jgi:cytochrome c-type biogenesis protein CcmH
VKSQFFLGLAAEQDGNKDKAASIWKAMLANASPGAPWVATVKEAITRVGGTPPAVAAAPGPNAAQMAAASQMSEQDRTSMIRGMVDRLAGKLKQDGNDVEGWQRLLRAYLVLGDHDKAVAAAGDAKRALASNPDKLRQIEDMIKSLGLEG